MFSKMQDFPKDFFLAGKNIADHIKHHLVVLPMRYKINLNKNYIDCNKNIIAPPGVDDTSKWCTNFVLIQALIRAVHNSIPLKDDLIKFAVAKY